MSAGHLPPRAIIFDFDGVIADNEWLHFECFRRVLGEEGIQLECNYRDPRFLGVNDREGVARAFADSGRKISETTARNLVERKTSYYRERLADVRLFPGIPELLFTLYGRCLLAIGSGGRADDIDTVLRIHGLRHYFQCIQSADDVPHSKPSPDCFLQVLESLRSGQPAMAGDLTPGDCLVVEDSLHGIRAARAAGMRCLAVAHTYPPEKLLGAERVVLRIGELKAEDLLAR